MPATVTLAVTRGKLRGEKFVFTERTTCIVGRGEDCRPRLPNDAHHRTISRHHCLLDVNPPSLRVRDFGSRNGTFVNGEKIGQRPEGRSREEAARLRFPERDLADGDEIELGDTVFTVSVFIPAVCGECWNEIPEGEREACREGASAFRCRDCREKTRPFAPADAASRPGACLQCGREEDRPGADQRGPFVCADCRDRPAAAVQRLLERARSGDEDLHALRGLSLVRELGRGGMGAVFLLRNDATGEEIAVKVMLAPVAVLPAARDLFLREVENTRSLDHPNVARLFASGCSQGVFFFTMEHCDGGSVEQLRRQRGGRLPVAEAAGLILQTLDGLEYAHQAEISNVRLLDGSLGKGRGLVHRDLSPHNILLQGAGDGPRAKVADFGLSKAFDLAGLSGHSATGNVAGKPLFVPRQQVVAFKYARPEVDVWAAAACLYALLTGTAPRDFPADQDPWKVVLQTDAVPIRRRDPAIPERLAAVIDRALVDRPAIGFRTAAEFKQALAGALP